MGATQDDNTQAGEVPAVKDCAGWSHLVHLGRWPDQEVAGQAKRWVHRWPDGEMQTNPQRDAYRASGTGVAMSAHPWGSHDVDGAKHLCPRTGPPMVEDQMGIGPLGGIPDARNKNRVLRPCLKAQ